MGIKMSVITRLVLCLFVLAITLPAHAQTPNPELVGMLTKQLNVTPEQATGGAGAIFSLVKSRLSTADFSKLATSVPGMDGFLNAAPAVKESSPLGSVSSMIPGGAGGAGGLASLAGSFKSLGLSPSMASKFVPVMQNYIQSKGGAGVANLFSGALK